MAENPVTHRPMAPLSDIFGGRKNTPSEIFKASRFENAGVVTNTRANDMALECPRCKAEGKTGVRMWSKTNVTMPYYCVNGHAWKDFDELMAMNPSKLPYQGIQARQEGWEKYELQVPGSLLKDLKTKYGDRLAATMRGVMEMLSQPRFLMVPEEDIKRLIEHTGIELKNSAQLVGAVYSLKTSNQNLEEANRLMKANRGGRATSPTAISVEFGDMADTILQKAADWGQEPAEIVADVMRKYIENGWV